MEKETLLADSMEIKDEKKAVEKEEKMADDSSRLDSLEEQLNQLRVDIAQLFEAVKGKKEEMGMEVNDEKEAVKRLQEKDQLQGEPNYGGPGKMGMSAQKKFNGAPVEEKTELSGMIKTKASGTMASVLSKMNNSKFGK
jgi:TolA-binding protein